MHTKYMSNTSIKVYICGNPAAPEQIQPQNHRQIKVKNMSEFQNPDSTYGY